MNPRLKFQLWSNRVELGWGQVEESAPHRAPKLSCPTPRPGWEEGGELLEFLLPSIHF